MTTKTVLRPVAVCAREAARVRRRSALGWSGGVLVLVLWLAAMYPSVRDQPIFKDLLSNYPPELRALFGNESDITTPIGYLKLELFSFMLPVLMLIAAIGAGAGILAGEEERGRLGLALARPISRRQLVVGRALAATQFVSVIAVVGAVGLAVIAPTVALHLPVARLLAGWACLWLLSLVFGAIALTVGAITARRSLGITVAAAIGVASYLADSFAGFAPWLRVVRRVSPFAHTLGLDPLRVGFRWWHLGGMVVAAVVIVAIGAEVFDRRDLRC